MTWRRSRVPSAAMPSDASGSWAEAPSASGIPDGSTVGASTGVSSGASDGAGEASRSRCWRRRSRRGAAARGAGAGSRGSMSRPDAVPAGSARGARPPTSHVSPARGRKPTVTRPPGVNSILSPAWAIASSYWTPGWRSPIAVASSGGGAGCSAAARSAGAASARGAPAWAGTAARSWPTMTSAAASAPSGRRCRVGAGRPGRRGAERVVTAVLGWSRGFAAETLNGRPQGKPCQRADGPDRGWYGGVWCGWVPFRGLRGRRPRIRGWAPRSAGCSGSGYGRGRAAAAPRQRQPGVDPSWRGRLTARDAVGNDRHARVARGRPAAASGR